MQPRRYALSFAFLSLAFAGCLISEGTTYRLTLNSDHKSGSLSIVSTHVESNASDSAGQNKDFAELLSNWKGDGYLLGQMEKGLYVKSRSLKLERGRLVWREIAIFSDVSALIPNFNFNDTMRFPLRDTSGLVITSNGMLSSAHGGMVVQWKPHTTTFEVATRMREFSPLSSFAQQFRRYRKN